MGRKEEMLNLKSRGRWTYVLTVDPGIAGTGWAHWPLITRPIDHPYIPEFTDVIHHAKGMTGERGVDEICSDFRDLILSLDPDHVVIEFDFQSLWSNSPASRASAAKGDLFKLAYLVGGFAEIVRNITNLPPVLVSPREWKGQLPKKAVDGRINLALRQKYRDHESDAVGMGLCLQGALL